MTNDDICRGFSVDIECHTLDGLNKMSDPEYLRVKIGELLDGLELQEEVDYTLAVRRRYGHKDIRHNHRSSDDRVNGCSACELRAAHAGRRLMHCPDDSPGVTHHEGPECADVGCTPLEGETNVQH
jgi:hypothetical protein